MAKNSECQNQNDVQNMPFAKKQEIIKKVVISYNQTAHGALSCARYYPTHCEFLISPDQSYVSQSLFSQFKRDFQFFDQFKVFPKNINEIHGLDLKNSGHLTKFVNYIAKTILFNHLNSNDNDCSQIISDFTNQTFNESTYQKLSLILNFYMPEVLSHGKDTLIKNYFNDNLYNSTNPGPKGPGKSYKLNKKFFDSLKLKEFMFFFTNDIYNDVLQKLGLALYHYVQSINYGIKAILQKTDAQTLELKQELKEKTDAQTLELKNNNDAQTQELKDYIGEYIGGMKNEITSLRNEVDQLRMQLDHFYKKDQEKILHKEKRKNRVKRPLTLPIQLDHFLACLTQISNGSSKTLSKQFSKARDRIAVFLLFFSGIRVGSLLTITLFDLIEIFQKRDSISLSVSKKREKKDTQSFLLADTVYAQFVHGEYNLYDDFLFILHSFDKWGTENSISEEKLYDHCFFSKYNNLAKPCSRVLVTKTINDSIRKAARHVASISTGRIKCFSSHSFRVNIVTHLIKNFGIRSAQQYIRHENISTTAIYDRNVFPIKSLLTLSSSMIDSKPKKKKVQHTTNQLTYDQQIVIANLINDHIPVDDLDDFKSNSPYYLQNPQNNEKLLDLVKNHYSLNPDVEKSLFNVPNLKEKRDKIKRNLNKKIKRKQVVKTIT